MSCIGGPTGLVALNGAGFALSGGERLRATLACVMFAGPAP